MYLTTIIIPLIFLQIKDNNFIPDMENCKKIIKEYSLKINNIVERGENEFTNDIIPKVVECELFLQGTNRTPCKIDNNFSETDLVVEREIDWRGGILCVGKVEIRIDPDLYNNRKVKVKLSRIPKYREDIFSLKDIYKLEPNGYDFGEGNSYEVLYYFDNNIIELSGKNINEEYLRDVYKKLKVIEIEQWPDEGMSKQNRGAGEKNDLVLVSVFNKEDGKIDDEYVEEIFTDLEKKGYHYLSIRQINPGRCYEDKDGKIYKMECQNGMGGSSVPFSEDAIGDWNWWGCSGQVFRNTISVRARRFGDIVVMHEVFENKPIRFKRMIDCTWLKPNKKQKHKK